MDGQQQTIREFLESAILWEWTADPGSWRKPHKYSGEVKKFLEQDNHRESILAEMKQVLEKWFTEGVTFETDRYKSLTTFLSPVPVYTNAPPELNDIIELANGAITWNIFDWKKIPIWMRTEVIQVASAVKETDGNKDLGEAAFGSRRLPPALGPVYDTEKDMKGQPHKRAAVIADNWYELTLFRTLHYIEEAHKAQSKEAAQRCIGAIEAFIYLEERLRAMGKIDLEILEFLDCKRGYKYTEIAEIQRNFGRSVKPNVIRANHIETAKRLHLDKGQQDEIGARQANFLRLLTKLSRNNT